MIEKLCKSMFEDDRYAVSLPWKENHLQLLTNIDVAKSQLKSLCKLDRAEVWKENYHKVVRDMESRGIVEEVLREEVHGSGFTISHITL